MHIRTTVHGTKAMSKFFTQRSVRQNTTLITAYAFEIIQANMEKRAILNLSTASPYVKSTDTSFRNMICCKHPLHLYAETENTLGRFVLFD